MIESSKCSIGKMAHTSDEFMIGSYPVDAYKPIETSCRSLGDGNIATATEYNSDATKMVDHTTDTGLEGGDCGGIAAVSGILEEAVKNLDLHIGKHTVVTPEKQR